nr:bifunctional 5,10-methylenetetrahydrofolate dehydrogenase/5,10-methenyltetrahydrofolate cyclohydrolase [Gammaproteobacteria bacterium]
MTAKLLSGIEVAEAVIADVRNRVERLAKQNIQPGLGTILVGDDGPSQSYVRKKHEACDHAGLRSFHLQLPSSTSQQELLDAVDEFNSNNEIDGYIIQYPVPKGLDFNEALMSMSPAKDADGLHPVNLGKLVLQEEGPVPCTPAGIQAILIHYGIEVSGKEVVIIGRGPTLGRPLSLLLTTKQEGANAAVTVVHSGVKDLAYFTRRADIVISAAGVASIVTPEMIKPGATVISGGISWQGKRLMPDVDESCADVAGWITPRLGGVGPTTVAMLLRNTVLAAEARK